MRMNKKIFIIVILLCIINLTACSSQSAGNVSDAGFSRQVGSVFGTGFYFDTVVSFTVYGTDDESIIDTLFTICENGEYYFSATKSDGELYKLNKGEISKVSDWLYKCANRANYYSEILNGKYDISIRPVSKLWDFRSGKAEVPDAKDIEKALEKVNYQDIRFEDNSIINLGVLDDGTASISKIPYYEMYLKEGMELDLGSAAKGFISDIICGYLKEEGIESAIISLGGNVQCLGGKLIGEEEFEDFKVAVKNPYADLENRAKAADGDNDNNDDSNGSNALNYSEILNVRDKAVVTSGIYERCFEKEGVLYHHILDATIGYPVQNDLASVTIICDSGLDADILSTVCFIAGYEGTKEKYVQLSKYGDFDAIFYFKDGTRKEIKASP